MRGTTIRLRAFLAVGIIAAGSDAMAARAPRGSTRLLNNGVAVQAMGSVGVTFEPNLGQAAPEVRYLSRQPGGTIFLTDSEIVVALRQDAPSSKSRDPSPRCESSGTPALGVIRISLEGARAERLSPGKPLGSVSNYFLGSDPRHWITHVPHEASATWVEALPGIDVRFHGDRGQFEFDLHVAAEALERARTLRVNVAGADSAKLDALGNLVLSVGRRELVLGHPVAWQESGLTHLPVRSEYVLAEDGRVELRVAGMKVGLPLVIDPTIVFSTYLGGMMDDAGTGLAVDATGAMYVSGVTKSLDFPTMSGLQPAHAGGGLNGNDAFVTRFAPSGAVDWSTYMGGTDDDVASAIALDSGGRPHVTGTTHSPDFPVMAAAQPVHAGGPQDVFVLALATTGDALAFSTFFGGPGDEQGIGLALDAADAVYVCGEAQSSLFPITAAPRLGPGGSVDMFVAKFSPLGASLEYATLVGGTGYDEGWALGVNAAGEALVAGPTLSTDFPQLSPVQPARGGGLYEAGLARLDASGSTWLQASYLGGASNDVIRSVKFDAAGNALIAGLSASPDFPLLLPIQSAISGAVDMTLTVLDPAGNLVRSTFLGGPGDDACSAMAIDPAGAVLLGGSVFGPGALEVDGLALPSLGGGSDAIIVKVDPTYSVVMFATAIGGTSDDDARAIGATPSGDIVLLGGTSSTDLPTVNPAQPANAGGEDAFLARISFCGPGGLLDLDQDGLDDRCATYKNHGDYVSAVAHACQEFGPPTGYASCGSVVRAAARSDIGKRSTP